MTTPERKTYFITVYLPKDAALRELLWKQAQGDISVSGQILRLIASDLKTRSLVTEPEHDLIKNFKFHRTTRVERDHQNNNYSFYIPKDLWWILDRFTSNLNGKIPYKNRSRYIWSLFTTAFSTRDGISYTRQSA